MYKRPLSSAVGIVLLLWLVQPQVFSFSDGFYLEVPYVRQVKNYCGPAALASVIRYWGRSADQHELAGVFKPFPGKGLSGAQLKQLAAEHQFKAYSFRGSRELVLEHLRKGRPLIVAISSSKLFNLNHYVILVGWDAVRQEWVLHDPADGPYRRLRNEKFLDRWGELDSWTLLILPGNGK